MNTKKKTVSGFAAAAFFCGLGFSAPAHALTITEFTSGITPAGTALDGIVVGPDGNLWFTEPDATKIGVFSIEQQSTIHEYPDSTGSGPSTQSITLGSDGNLWFPALTADGVVRMDVSGQTTLFTTDITPASVDGGITDGPDGRVWFAGAPNQIGAITTDGQATEFTAGITPNSQPAGITVGSDGNLWFTESNTNQVARITPTGTVTEFSQGISANSTPVGITSGPDGNLWFTDLDNDRIVRVTTAGVSTEFAQGITAGASPFGITGGPDGNIWFVEFLGDKVGRITPDGVVTEFSEGIAPNSFLSKIVTGPDGNLWFTGGGLVGQVLLPHLTLSGPTSVNAPIVGSTSVTLDVNVSPASEDTITVNYATVDGTAVAANGDYNPTSGTLTLNPGETSASINVVVNAPQGSNVPVKTFSVELSQSHFASLGSPDHLSVEIHPSNAGSGGGCSLGQGAAPMHFTWILGALFGLVALRARRFRKA